MRRGWLRRNRLTTTLPHMIRLCGRVWLPAAAPRCFYFQRYTAPQPSCPARTASPISLVKSLSGGLGLKTRRPPGRLCRALRIPVSIRSSAVGIPLVPTQGEYPIPLARSVAVRRPVRPKRNPRNRPENSLTSSGENSVTRYTHVRTFGKNSVQVRYYSGVQKQEVVPVSDTREKAYSFCSLGS
jgi:hypothetical protein